MIFNDEPVKDCFNELVELYIQGNQVALINKMLPHPDASYDSLKSEHPVFRYLVNYWDSLFFRPLVHSMLANQEVELQFNSIYGELKNQLLPRLNKEASALKNAYGQAEKAEIPHASLSRLIEAKPELLPLCQHSTKRDNIPFAPLLKELALPLNCSIPEEPSLLIFEEWIHLVQCLQFPEVFQAVSKPDNCILLLDKYPNTLLQMQKIDAQVILKSPKIFLSPHHRIQESIPLLTKSLNALLEDCRENIPSDSKNGDWLFNVAKRVLYSIKQEKYGKERTPALVDAAATFSWFSPHKLVPGKEFDLGPDPVDYFPEIVKDLSRHRLKPAARPIQVTHIVPQIIDDKHAPSHILENLLVHSSKSKFKIKVIVTERLVVHGKEYPNSLFMSASTPERGKKRLQAINAAGVSIHVYGNRQTYLEKAHTVAQELQETQTDIAIFHGPDVINMMATQLAPSPLRVLFDHGTPPSFPGFDLLLASTNDAQKLFKDRFEGFDMKIESLPFCIDLRNSWPKDPPTLESLELPSDCLAMTTISNHLGDRLSSEMCLAIATILQRVPNAVYAPIGRVSEEFQERLLKVFEGFGVADRIKFLGERTNPSHLARCMKLYLNEFPFGSGIGMLDAMASSCVVVSMYDPKGPSQARYGAEYMGRDKVIDSNQVEDYVTLAVKLLTDPNMYKEWSEHALKQYERHANEVEYVQKFEEILLKHFINSTGKTSSNS